MDRINVINRIIEKINGKIYLEIGVQTGAVIAQVRCRRKIGVDPEFLFRISMKMKRMLGICTFETYKMTSDVFFGRRAEAVLRKGVDVVLIDGLHTYQQAKRDIENSLVYLNKGGVIVVHDCNPLNEAAAYPIHKHVDEVKEKVNNWDLPGWQGQWNGDVWKAIADLIFSRSDIYIFTLDMDYGIGIITKGKQELNHNFSISEIKDGDYTFFSSNRTVLINLKNPIYFFNFLYQEENINC